MVSTTSNLAEPGYMVPGSFDLSLYLVRGTDKPYMLQLAFGLI